MKNDFDFIKEKIDNSAVNAPADMGGDYALKAIQDSTPKPVAVEKRPKRRTAAIIAAAASFVLVAAIGTAVGINLSKKNTPGLLTLPGGLSLRTFSDRSQVEDTVKGILDERSGHDGIFSFLEDAFSGNLKAGNSEIADESTAAAGAEGGTSASHSETYKQVDGVDEADIIKTDGSYIYVADYGTSGKISIFDVNGDSELPIAELNVKTHTVSSPDEADPYKDDFKYEEYYGTYRNSVQELYLKDERLIVLGEDFTADGTTSYAYVYDVSDIGKITLLDSMRQSGIFISSRMIGDTLYTVSSYTPNSYDKMIPVCGDADDPKEIACGCIYAPESPQSESFLVVSVYDTLGFGSEDIMSKAIFGAAQDIYCNQSSLYIYSTVFDNRNNRWYYSTDNARSHILKVDLTDALSFSAYAEIPGIIYDQYALDEYNGNLRVATTTNNGGTDTNNLYVLDDSLSIIGSVTGFAETESIKAVRYLGDTAYVITYEQTDPLFVIDLSTPTAPEILGEVEITGFSTMLVPVDENTILGIGYHTQNEDYTDMEVQEGVKLALFDVSDKANPKVLDSISYVDHYSPVTFEPKALVYNPERGDYVIPLNYWGYSEERGGMLNFKAENGKIVEISKYTADYIYDVERCVYVGDTVYLICRDRYDNLCVDRVKYE